MFETVQQRAQAEDVLERHRRKQVPCRVCHLVPQFAKWWMFTNRTIHLVWWCPTCSRFTGASPLPRWIWPLVTEESPERAAMRLAIENEPPL